MFGSLAAAARWHEQDAQISGAVVASRTRRVVREAEAIEPAATVPPESAAVSVAVAAPTPKRTARRK